MRREDIFMLRGIDVAIFFLNLDKEHKVFNKNLCTKNGRTFYEGNARLNKYLHLAQNIYIAKYKEPLMDSIFYAYDNGAVDPYVQENYSVLLDRNNPVPDSISERESDYLKRIFEAFRYAELDELIELSHEDPEWINKHGYYRKDEQKMNSMAHMDEYVEQYADIIKVLERMNL